MKHKNDKNMFLLFVPLVQCVHDVDGLLPLLDACCPMAGGSCFGCFEACCPCREKHDNTYPKNLSPEDGRKKWMIMMMVRTMIMMLTVKDNDGDTNDARAKR